MVGGNDRRVGALWCELGHWVPADAGGRVLQLRGLRGVGMRSDREDEGERGAIVREERFMAKTRIHKLTLVDQI